MPDRLPPPWTVQPLDACYRINDANGVAIAYVYFSDDTGAIGTGISERLTKDQARRVAAQIARLPELLAKG